MYIGYIFRIILYWRSYWRWIAVNTR